MIAVFANSFAIVIGVIVGLVFKKFIPKEVSPEIFKAIGLGIIVVGLQKGLQTDNVILMISSLAIGSLIGTLIDIDGWVTRLGNKLEKKVSKQKDSKVSVAFVNSSILFCSGAMAVFGSLEAGIAKNYETLFSKSIIDGISSVFFTISLGFGVVFSAVSTFLYQGAITLSAGIIKPYITEIMIHELSTVGSVMIAAIGFNMIGATKIKIANLLPALIIPVVYYMFF